MTTRIFLVEDHQLVRQGVRMLLEAEAGFEVVGEAGNGVDAVEAIAHLQPDILIIDVVLPDINGMEVAREAIQRLPGVKVVMLSMYDNAAYVQQAFEAGAVGYVLKSSTGAHLIQAVHKVITGKPYLSPPLNFEALEEYAQYSHRTNGQLTERERQVLQMAAQGMGNPEIARRLSLSVRTVEMHRAHVLKKLNLKNQTELVRYALAHALVE